MGVTGISAVRGRPWNEDKMGITYDHDLVGFREELVNVPLRLLG
jgi:hypothetical protein